MESGKYHTPVLLQETINYLVTKSNGIYVDGTLGGGGHAKEILKRLDRHGKLIGIDIDEDAITEARKQLSDYADLILFHKENFKNIKAVLSQLNINAISGVLLDLGVSSYQLDEPTKGFSYRSDEIIDMRMNKEQQLDARYILNKYDENTLANILWKYGEERYSRKIAREIIKYRNQIPIETTGQLVSVVRKVIGKNFLVKSLSRVFQAIRIEVNNELENLRIALLDCIELLETGGRLAVISYHSLEDRLVKEIFRMASKEVTFGNKKVKIKLLTKKPITASEEEIRKNPRARSAKLRVAEKL